MSRSARQAKGSATGHLPIIQLFCEHGGVHQAARHLGREGQALRCLALGKDELAGHLMRFHGEVEGPEA